MTMPRSMTPLAALGLIFSILLVAQAADVRPSVAPGKDGVVALSSAGATLSGGDLKVADGALAGWTDSKQSATWQVEKAPAGSYDVFGLLSVDADAAGETFAIDIDGQTTIRAELVATTPAGSFERKLLGRVLLTGSKLTVSVHGTNRKPHKLGQIKLLELIPAGAGIAADAPPFTPPPLKVPAGFSVELVAGPPLVAHPMLASFDNRGRLFVAESVGVNSRGAVLAENPPHEIRVLEDTNGDGRFDKSTLFADKLVFPQGIVWHDDAVYVSSPPNFWRLRDTNGDGVADERTILATGFANTGVADDMHGASLGPDGRVYWCAGRFPHKIRRPDGPVVHEGTAPLILRCKPDGTELEVVCGSQGNAVGVAFTDAGDCFASGTFLASDSMGPNLRDALIHCVDGGQYPVRDKTIKEHKRTGDLLPALTHLGVSASSDVMIYRGGAFNKGANEDFQGNLFSALFNMHKVLRHVITPDGATYRCRNEDFLTSTSTDFHPTDVFEDADGSVLVIDTGGWFIIGCPTSQIAKPQVLGGIYRVRRDGAKQVPDPRGLQIEWKKRTPNDLVMLLNDKRFAVRDRAMCELATRGAESLPALAAAIQGDPSPRARPLAGWTLCRIEGDNARSDIRKALADADDGVRQAAARTAGIQRDKQAVSALVDLLRAPTFPVRREAATALGRIGDSSAVPALLAALGEPSDRFLDHALIFALIRLDDRQQTLAGLDAQSPAVRAGALLALDQMDHGELTREELARTLDSNDAVLQRTALDVVGRRPGWAAEITGLAERWLAEPELSADRQASLRGVLLAFAHDASIQELISKSLAKPNKPRWTDLLLLEIVSRAELAETPKAWQAGVVAALASGDAEISRQAVAAAAVLGRGIATGELLSIARDTARPSDLRVAAAAVLSQSPVELPPEVFAFLADQCQGDVEPVVRLAAARAIGGANLSAAARERVARLLAAAGPLEAPALVGAFEKQTSAESGRQLIAALEVAPGVTAVAASRLVKMLDQFPPEVREAAGPLLKRLSVDPAEQAARLSQLAGALAAGDAKHGREIFFGARAACSACHRVGAEGASIGPNLSGIGAIRARRDMLEAIVFPSASFARGFEPVAVATKDGQVHSGIIGRETATAVYLRTTDRAEIRIARSDIDELSPSTVSIMPQGLDKALTAEELRDLIEFLSAQRADPSAATAAGGE
jgi:putative membrane-bound dehydrogenase-like protein